jgi:hypothetical protein
MTRKNESEKVVYLYAFPASLAGGHIRKGGTAKLFQERQECTALHCKCL